MNKQLHIGYCNNKNHIYDAYTYEELCRSLLAELKVWRGFFGGVR